MKISFCKLELLSHDKWKVNDHHIHLETKGGLSKIIKSYMCDKISQCKGKSCIDSSAFPVEFCVNTLSSEYRCFN